jgi:hypothetical protein
MEKSTKKLEPSIKKPIIREKVWIDTKIVNTTCKHLDNKITQCVFKSDMDPSVVPKDFAKNNSDKMVVYVCFSGLIRQIMDTKEVNRMYYKVEVAKPNKSDPASQIVLTPEERSGWLSLTKKYRLLPPYINEDAIEDIPKRDQKLDTNNMVSCSTAIASGEFIIDLKGLSPAMLYIYLSTIRNIREDPGLPRAVLYLVNEIGMNFFAAYVFSGLVTLNSTGHHILDTFRPYGLCKETYNQASKIYTSDPLDLKHLEASIVIPIGKAIGLQRMVNNDPLKYDKRDIINKSGSMGGFDCATTISKISKVVYSASFQELFDGDIIAAIMSKDDKEADKCLKRFTEKKPRIKYKEAKR